MDTNSEAATQIIHNSIRAVVENERADTMKNFITRDDPV